jgi:hypothetical protein
MFNLSVKKQARKNLISKGYSLSYNVSLLPSLPNESLNYGQLGKFTEVFCENLPELFPFQKLARNDSNSLTRTNTGFTTNIRGSQISKTTARYNSPKETFFLASGNITNQTEQSELDQLQSFFFEISSAFKNFDGRNKIHHSVTRRCSNELNNYLPFLSAASFGRLVGIELNSVSFGFEIFKERFLGSYFGLAPVIEQRFHLDLTSNNILLIVEDDCTDSSSKLILEDIQLFTTLDKAFVHSEIYPNFSEQLIKHIH